MTPPIIADVVDVLKPGNPVMYDPVYVFCRPVGLNREPVSKLLPSPGRASGVVTDPAAAPRPPGCAYGVDVPERRIAGSGCFARFCLTV